MEQSMCLIAYRRNDSEKFKEEYFYPAAERNSDGIGIMYTENGRVIHKKLGEEANLVDKRALWREFDKAHAPSMLHVRIGTAGNKGDTFNAHPFKILDKDDGDPVDLYMMHNGMMSTADFDDTKSDTWHFANAYIKPLVEKNPYLLCNAYIKALLSKFVGSSRVVFLYGCGTVVVIEDYSSHTDEKAGGCWLSNRTLMGGQPYNPFVKEKSKSIRETMSEFYGSNYNDTYEKNLTNITDKTMNKKTQSEAEEEKAGYSKLPVKTTESEAIETDGDTDNPDIADEYELANTVDEQIEDLKEYDDVDIEEMIQYNPTAAAKLLGNLRDYFRSDLFGVDGNKVSVNQ